MNRRHFMVASVAATLAALSAPPDLPQNSFSGFTGTNDISSLLAAQNQSAAAFGMNTIAEVLQNEIAAHNALMRTAVEELCEISTDRQRISGGGTLMEMVATDEYGRAPTQKQQANAQVAFPLTKYEGAVGWTRMWERQKTPADFARATIALQAAHRRLVLREIKKAIMLSANYTVTDDLVDNINLAVKRLANADGAPIAPGPNGEFFDGTTHTHYGANATLTPGAVDSHINTVVEHGNGARVRTYTSRSNEAAWRALTGFLAYQEPNIQVVLGVVDTPRLDRSRLDNKPIGTYAGSEVWLKPWMPANYSLTFDLDGPKPLVIREMVAGSMNLNLIAEIDIHPLRVQNSESIFGVGVWSRINGAMLYFAGGAYTDPVIT